jgi:hypothetical protein
VEKRRRLWKSRSPGNNTRETGKKAMEEKMSSGKQKIIIEY